MFPIIDFHVHVYPALPLSSELKKVRSSLKSVLEPVSQLQHNAQSLIRKFPQFSRKFLEEITTPSVIPHLLIESQFDDLITEMNTHNVEKAVVIPHPPIISNDFVYYECRKAPNRLITSTFIDPQTMTKKEDLVAFYNQGVRIFKINPIQSGVPAEAPYYNDFLEYLNSKKAIVILHTGNIYSHLFKAPDKGDVKNFIPWFTRYPDIKFLLAHMNFNEPHRAIEQASLYENVFLLTSWQPTDVIEKAINKVGVSKILFASDWPLLGGNILTQKNRILQLFKNKKISEQDLKNIFAENAKHLLA